MDWPVLSKHGIEMCYSSSGKQMWFNRKADNKVRNRSEGKIV